MIGNFDRACELLPPWTKELYLYTVAPLPSLWPLPPLPKLNVQYIQTVCVCGGGVGVELCCGPYSPYSAGVLSSVSDQIQNLQNWSTTPNKMTSEDDIKGLVSLTFVHALPFSCCFRSRFSCICKISGGNFVQSEKNQTKIFFNWTNFYNWLSWIMYKSGLCYVTCETIEGVWFGKYNKRHLNNHDICSQFYFWFILCLRDLKIIHLFL
jgi:hypothetical protein